VLTFAEAAQHPHAVARGAHVSVGDVAQPAPAPRFSRTPGAISGGAPERGERGREALADWGFASEQVAALEKLGLGCA
jgi:alpha-methylacyl-CoA racemase